MPQDQGGAVHTSSGRPCSSCSSPPINGSIQEIHIPQLLQWLAPASCSCACAAGQSPSCSPRTTLNQVSIRGIPRYNHYFITRAHSNMWWNLFMCTVASNCEEDRRLLGTKWRRRRRRRRCGQHATLESEGERPRERERERQREEWEYFPFSVLITAMTKHEQCSYTFERLFEYWKPLPRQTKTRTKWSNISGFDS